MSDKPKILGATAGEMDSSAFALALGACCVAPWAVALLGTFRTGEYSAVRTPRWTRVRGESGRNDGSAQPHGAFPMMPVGRSSMPVMRSQLTCPSCQARYTQTMPMDACIYFFECGACGAMLRPKPGDCCVFCSYGSVPCPPVQTARAEGDIGGNCCN